jgi:hypothetical protein
LPPGAVPERLHSWIVFQETLPVHPPSPDLALNRTVATVWALRQEASLTQPTDTWGGFPVVRRSITLGRPSIGPAAGRAVATRLVPCFELARAERTGPFIGVPEGFRRFHSESISAVVVHYDEGVLV